jgi:hypothetical protein
MRAKKSGHQWAVTEDPRLTLTQEAVMADLQARAVAYVCRRCPDDAGLILDMLGLSEATS